jgi:hypothetical protein
MSEKITVLLIAVLIVILSGTFLKLVWETGNGWRALPKAAGTVAVLICLGAAIAMLALVAKAFT